MPVPYILGALAYLACALITYAINAYLDGRRGIEPKIPSEGVWAAFVWPFQVLAVLVLLVVLPFVIVGRKARELGERHRQEATR